MSLHKRGEKGLLLEEVGKGDAGKLWLGRILL